MLFELLTIDGITHNLGFDEQSDTAQDDCIRNSLTAFSWLVFKMNKLEVGLFQQRA